jgi:hypothetical protein
MSARRACSTCSSIFGAAENWPSRSSQWVAKIGTADAQPLLYVWRARRARRRRRDRVDASSRRPPTGDAARPALEQLFAELALEAGDA